ncbi:hypothetical protein AXG93_4794s1190 [Marchantia polymorpha subsp. ruderalis]|uniref:Centrosomal protein of 44 kDa n=1 Tax=Marchantia polymorpha subsp. ruderalis TaxID=1480154 RepID=A0A176VFY5_MARPO|nr:hypothetical protein AXG93_4794s1190 [Marchantia polymorpha subsp. ruderalis]
MATGDLRGNLERLRTQLLSVNYPHPFDVQGLKQGIPAVVLPLLHYALLGYSRHVARYLSANGYELYAKSDLRFMESALKFFRHEFNYRCALTIAQMFSRGYAERKMIFIYDAVQMTKRKHNELLKLGREKTIDKTELTQINYETMPGCGLGNAKVQAVDRLPFYEPKPWEHTLRSSKNPVRCSKDAECQLVDITVLPVPEPTSPRAPNSDSNVVHNQHGLCTEDSDKKSWELASRMRAKKLQPKAKKFVMSLQNSAEVPHPAASELSEGESEICQRIMDMADKLEARFSTLEDGVTRAKETLQEKLVGLEGRVQSLESVVSSKVTLVPGFQPRKQSSLKQ